MILVVLCASCKKGKEPTPDPVPDSLPAVEKCKASDYSLVIIGTQVWMTENYRCSKYDTESEAYKAGIFTIPASSGDVYTPYYVDAADKSKWATTEYSGNLKDEQISKMGYIYNWAAAVGIADGKSQISAFTGNRQGICPNGWHVPSYEEWSTLGNFLDGNYGQTEGGKKLKTTSGWYSGGNGIDSYGFAALPAGGVKMGSVDGVGNYAGFWTATPFTHSEYAYARYLNFGNDQMDDYHNGKYYGFSVRCLKN